MPDYRLYRMNRHSGHIEGVEEFTAADDLEAIAKAHARPRETPAELWCGSRKLLRLDAPPEAAGPAPARAAGDGVLST